MEERLKPDLLIFGAGGHAKVTCDCARDAYPRLMLVSGDDSEGEWNGFPICPEGWRSFSEWRALCPRAFVAIGNRHIRAKVMAKLEQNGFDIVTLVHPSAVVSPSAALGPGTLVCPRAVVNADARTGKGCIVNTGVIVEHECRIGEYVHLSPGAALGGGVMLGDGTWVCLGAAVADHLTIGRGVVIGAGAAVIGDVEDDVLVAGIPACVKKRYLAQASL